LNLHFLIRVFYPIGNKEDYDFSITAPITGILASTSI